MPFPHPATRINWFRVLDDIIRQESGSLKQAGRELDVPRATLMAWRDGVEPRHADGERLIAYWVRVTKRERSDLPIEPRYPNAHSRRRS
jgi:hypothetical protein